ncbi:MAG: hypothetical protein M1840_001463 [Geoglossum simile]|nr:MAG: hypothetical protein M1840_001463 [Geoglossum simile]
MPWRLLSLLRVRAALQFVNNTDFNLCSQRLLDYNRTSSDPLIDNSTFFKRDRLWMTIQGCERLCGGGVQLWEWQATVSRLFLWVIPGLVLLTHFHFPPLPWYNSLDVIVHAIGDPVDSLQSMLTRYEVYQRLSRVARGLEIMLDGQDSPEHAAVARDHIASIWAAYEEAGWHDASNSFCEALEQRNRDLTWKEMHCIVQAGRELSSNRLDSTLTSWVAIGTLIFALVAATVRTVEKVDRAQNRLDIETSHTIAVVALLFIFIPLVKFSGDIGSFTSVQTTVNVIGRLNDRLGSDRPRLFKLLRLWRDPRWSTDENGGIAENPAVMGPAQIATENIENWPNIAHFFGMNSSWRPDKNIKVNSKGRSPTLILVYSLAFVILGSSAPAIFVSATNRAGAQIVGYGCRSLTWTVLLFVRLCSFGINYLLRWKIKSAKTLWRIGILKDSILAAFITFVVFVVQLGVYNSCWCRSNVISLHEGAYINLSNYTDSEWLRAKLQWAIIPLAGLLFTGCLILWIELHGGRVRGLLRRSQRKLRKDREMLDECKQQGKVPVLMWRVRDDGLVVQRMVGRWRGDDAA